MDTLTRTRQQLDALLAEISDERAAIEARERATAQAAEQLTQDAAVRAAWQQASAAMKGQIVALIDTQLDMLQRGGTNALVLTALRRQVVGVEG
jgi:hypothetical protein